MNSTLLLARRAAKAITAHYERTTPPLTIPQLEAMQVIASDGPLYQHEIVVMTGSDRSTMSVMLRHLREMQYVVSIRDGQDERRVMASITASGRRAIATALKHLDAAESAIKLTLRERTAIRAGLEKITLPDTSKRRK